MKEFIIGFAVFILLMFFPLQWTLNQVNHYKIESVNNIVHVAAQKARIEGYFTPDNISEMRDKIANALTISGGDITIDVTTIPKYRFKQFNSNEMIKYDIKIPIKRIVAMNQFFGIDNNSNQLDYHVSGEIPSELLAP